MAESPLFRRVALIGLGLIGSSLARAMRRGGLAGHIAGHARSRRTRDKAIELGFVDSVHAAAAGAAAGADLAVGCVPPGAPAGNWAATAPPPAPPALAP